MLDELNSNRSEKRSVIMSQVFHYNYNIDIVALSEVRLAENVCVRGDTGSTFYCSRKISKS